MAESKQYPFHFALAGLTTEQFRIDPTDFSTDQQVDISLSFNFRHNAADEMIGVYTTLQLGQNQKELVLLEVACHFKIQRETWQQVIEREEGKRILPLKYAWHLATIATGTARGVLHAQLSGTPFAHYVLPVVNLREIIQSDLDLTAGD